MCTHAIHTHTCLIIIQQNSPTVTHGVHVVKVIAVSFTTKPYLLSVHATDLLSVRTKTLLSVQRTDVLSVHTTDLLSVQTPDLLSGHFHTFCLTCSLTTVYAPRSGQPVSYRILFSWTCTREERTPPGHAAYVKKPQCTLFTSPSP